MDDFFWSIRRMCDIVLNNNFGNKALDSLALYVGHDSRVLNAAQSQETEERSENSPASPVQQLKAEIAALESRLRMVGCISAEDTEELCSICAEMRQLSAV